MNVHTHTAELRAVIPVEFLVFASNTESPPAIKHKHKCMSYVQNNQRMMEIYTELVKGG